jgi:ATP-dependent exoDNAse (exonuclease V) beta subunit
MTTLHNILSDSEKHVHATDTGTKMHALLQRVVIDKEFEQGDQQLIQKIKQNSTITRFFTAAAKTEVPIAGFINGKFISRRIDRLLINHTNKQIDIIDYKTDTSRDNYVDNYRIQLHEYAQLLHKIYPSYSVKCYILWTHDFSLENII